MNKDWNGNKKSTFVTIGASNHCEHERADFDYYATEPKAVHLLCAIEEFRSPILEPAYGEGHISKALLAHGYDVVSRDVVDRGYGAVADFLHCNEQWNGDIITNPPYSKAHEFVEQALRMVREGGKVAMFLKLTFLEGQKRSELFKRNPPIRVWVSRSRLKCAINGDFDSVGSSATAYAWFIWEKGYKGTPEILLFN